MRGKRGRYASLTPAQLCRLAEQATVSPIAALYWSAVINGVVAVPVIVAMMLMTADQRVMEGFKIPWPLRFLGRATAGAMGLAVLTMAATWMI